MTLFLCVLVFWLPKMPMALLLFVLVFDCPWAFWAVKSQELTTTMPWALWVVQTQEITKQMPWHSDLRSEIAKKIFLHFWFPLHLTRKEIIVNCHYKCFSWINQGVNMNNSTSLEQNSVNLLYKIAKFRALQTKRAQWGAKDHPSLDLCKK